MAVRLAVLASGGGTNLQAIIDYLDTLGARRSADLVLVASDRPDAGALDRVRDRGIPARSFDARRDDALERMLREHDVDLIALAGYVRFVPASVTTGWNGRIVNVHPALLPAFGGRGMYGRRVHEAAIAAGVRVSGATVHFVDAVYDHGPIIAQWPVPVFPVDDARTLAERVLRVEHLLYPRVIDGLAAGRIRLVDGQRVSGTVTWMGGAEDSMFVLSASGLDSLEISSAFTGRPVER